MLNLKLTSFDTNIKPTWCPGCANYLIFNSLKRTFLKLNLAKEKIVAVTDIGCCGNAADFFSVYGFHSLHGRAVAAAAGIKLANHKLIVFAIIGDGGCYGEGLTHFLNLMRGNHDIKVFVFDNYLYSLTTGQYSPTTPKGTVTKSTPNGSIEDALNPLALSLINHATFCSRVFAFNQNQLNEVFEKAFLHSGFAFIDILQPCITLNKTQTMLWYQEKIKQLPNIPQTKEEALKLALDEKNLYTGIFWQEYKPCYHEQIKILKYKTLVNQREDIISIQKFLKDFS